NSQAIKHARLTNREVADIDHLLHFAFAFGDNLSGLERHELPEIMFKFTQGVAQTANGIAANRPGRGAPLQKSLVRARNPSVVIIGRSRAHAGQFLAIDRRDFVNLCATSAPFAVKDASVVVSQTEFL